MAANNNPTAHFFGTDTKAYLSKQIRTHEVAIAEINDKTVRAVYQKNGNIFFRTSIDKATTSEQQQLDLARAKLEKLSSQ